MSAIISPDGLYRYRLERDFGKRGHEPCVFIMLNPSTADAEQDDPTIRRCKDFARMQFGCRLLIVVNLFAFRATDPAALATAKDPIGPDNDAYILGACSETPLIVCAWGNHGSFLKRGEYVKRLLLGKGIKLRCLGITKTGEPKHPLYLAANTRLENLK